MYGWSTLPYRMEDNYQDTVNKCDLELVFLKCWAFGEVKKIRGPTGTCTSTDDQKKADDTSISKNVIPSNVTDSNVITGNVRCRSNRAQKQILPALPKKVTQRTSTRKRQIMDYSKLDEELDTPSPPHK